MKRVLLALAISMIFTSCATRRVVIYCEPQKADIYVDEQLMGQGIVYYNIPRGQKYITISCGEDGVIYTSRIFNAKSIAAEINIRLDEYKRYSSDNNSLSPL